MNDHDTRWHYQQHTLFDPQPETRAANRVLRLLTDHDLPNDGLEPADLEPDGLERTGVTDNNNDDEDGEVGEWW